jgi:mycoredoxin
MADASSRALSSLPSAEPSAEPSASQPGRIVMFSTAWCADCRRARRVFAELGVTYDEIDIDEYPEAAAVVVRINGGARSVPTIVFADGSILTEPRHAELAAKLRSLSVSS